MLVFGAATDYALLLIARYREQLHTTTDHRQALAAAVRDASPAILASGGTVIAGLLCLLAATTPSIRGLGPVAALGVADGLIAGLTLLPALLAVTGRRAFWPRTPHPAATSSQPPHTTAPAPAAPAGGWVWLGTLIARRPRLVWMLNIFLMTRVRDETRQHGTRGGTVRVLALTGGVITSAGLVLAATFTTLAVLPLVVLTETGLAVALGVLLDTFLVRSLLVPALTLDLDRHTWWPSTLAHRTSTPQSNSQTCASTR